MAKRGTDVDSEIETLFQLPHAEFTAARNALAARLKKAGRADDAARVKGIQKPPATAWTVNQLYWQDRDAIEALLDVGERFRKAQAAQLSGQPGDLRALLNERREVLSRLMTRAGDLLRDGDHVLSPDATRRIATTLEALATWGRTPGAPQPGRLTDDLDPPGFEALAALVPRPGGGKDASEPSRLLHFRKERAAQKVKKSPDDDAAVRAKAREAVQAAEKALREAQRDAERAEAALKKAAARAKAAEKEKEAVEQRYEQLVKEAQAAAKEARKVAEGAEEAAQAVTEAERDLEKARAALAQLDA